MIVGFILSLPSPRMKKTNEAIMVAMRHGNRLSVARLALEMDITLDKAEQIIQTLVHKGIAEIDLESDDPQEGIIYKIKGI